MRMLKLMGSQAIPGPGCLVQSTWTQRANAFGSSPGLYFRPVTL